MADPRPNVTKLPPVTLSNNQVLRTIDAARRLKIDNDRFLALAKRAGITPSKGRHGSSMWSEADVEAVVRYCGEKGISLERLPPR